MAKTIEISGGPSYQPKFWPSLIKDFFQGYEPLQYALEPNNSPIFEDYQDQNFNVMYDMLKNKFNGKPKSNNFKLNKHNIFIVSFCITTLILLLINSRFSLLSTYDKNKNRIPNIKIIFTLSLIVAILVAIINY